MIAEPSDNDCHRYITKKQPQEIQLTLETFSTLRREAGNLSDNEKKVLRATALLKPTDALIKAYNDKNQQKLPKDSEQKLSQFAQWFTLKDSQPPRFIQKMSYVEKIVLAQAYSESFHMRHFIFAETCVAEIKKAVEKVENLKIVKWRWIIDLCGFDRAQHGLTEPLLKRLESVFSLIESIKNNEKTAMDFFDFYFKDLQVMFSLNENEIFNQLSDGGKRLVTQLIAYYEAPAPDFINDIVNAYAGLNDLQDLERNYKAYITSSDAEAPTYLPAVLKTAHSQFTNINSSPKEAIFLAVKFTVFVLSSVYEELSTTPNKKINAKQLAMADNWREHKWAKRFKHNLKTCSVKVLDSGDVSVAFEPTPTCVIL